MRRMSLVLEFGAWLFNEPDRPAAYLGGRASISAGRASVGTPLLVPITVFVTPFFAPSMKRTRSSPAGSTTRGVTATGAE